MTLTLTPAAAPSGVAGAPHCLPTIPAMQLSSDHHRTLLNNIPHRVFFKDLRSTFVLVNASFAADLGMSPQDLVGKTDYDLFPEEFARKYRADDQRVMTTGLTEVVEEVNLLNGRPRVVEVTKTPVINDDQEVIGLLGLYVDVTARHRAEIERQISFEIIQGINSTSDLDELLALIREALRKIIPVENFCVALHDRAADQLRWQFFIDQRDQPPPPQALGKGRTAYVFRSGRPVLLTAELFRTLIEQGEAEEVGTPPAAWVGLPLITPSETIGVLVVQHYEDPAAYSSRDVEFLTSVGGQIALAIERLQAEEKLKTFAARLERSNRELQEFASVASHDLQEPLRKIQAFGDRLHAKCGDALNDAGRDYLGRMQSAAARMQNLINGLLMFSRVTTKGQPFVPVDLGVVAGEVVSDLEVRLEQTGGRVEFGEMMTIDADPLQMRQLLQNLIGNALKFHPADVAPVVRVHCAPVTAENGEEACQLAVADNGIGFDEKYLDRIFNVFQRLHGRLEYEGTGVGLAVCRRIAERHNGRITAHSTPDQGATFLVTLPIIQTKGENTP